MSDVAIYVQRAYDRETYAKESYDIRIWAGVEMVRDALERAGVGVEYCSAATVHRYRVVLVSITSSRDWYSSTPFKALPATPAATWPMPYREYRGAIAPGLRRHTGLRATNSVFYDGRALWAFETLGTESLSSNILEALILRGTEADTETVERVARSKRFWNASAVVRRTTLEKYCDVDRLFRAYAWAELPTRYLHTYVERAKLARLGERAMATGP